MQGVDRDAGRAQPAGELFDQGHRAVLAAGAADRDRRVALVLADITGQHRLQGGGIPSQEVVGALLGQHEARHVSVPPGQRPQLGHPERVRQEPHVGHMVGVQRQAVLEPERHHGQPDRGAAQLSERFADLHRELVHVQPRGVQHGVGGAAQVGQQAPFALDAVQHGALGLQRVRPADRLEPAHQGVVGGVQEQQPGGGVAQLGRVQRLLQVAEEGPAPHIDHHRQPRHRRGGPAGQLGQAGHQQRRQVVDHIPAEVLEDMRRGRSAGPRHPGDHQQLLVQLHPGGCRRDRLGLFTGCLGRAPRGRLHRSRPGVGTALR